MLDSQALSILGLNATPLASEIKHVLQSSGIDIFDGICSSEDGVESIIESLDHVGRYKVKVVKPLVKRNLKYLEIFSAHSTDPIKATIIGDYQSSVYPTKAENLIIWALFYGETKLPLHLSIIDCSSGRLINWREKLRGLAIIAEPIDLSNQESMAAHAILGLQHHSIEELPDINGVFSDSSEIILPASFKELQPVLARLIFEAVSTYHPKWRFLSFYRILESCYLANIRECLIKDFNDNAISSVKDALDKLQSEPNQLVSLMEERDLSDLFIDFNAKFQELISAGNRYANLLDRSMKDELYYKSPNLAHKGAIRLYKIRCSIAHAGGSSVVFENMNDSIQATASLLPAIESIALKCLSIQGSGDS